MARTDLVSDALNQITAYETLGKRECVIRPVSNLLINILRKLKELGYIGEFELIKDNKGSVVKIELTGRINKIRAIRPRFSAKVSNIEKYEERYLPAYNFGHLILSTPKGILSHEEAKKMGVGGKLLVYVF